MQHLFLEQVFEKRDYLNVGSSRTLKNVRNSSSGVLTSHCDGFTSPFSPPSKVPYGILHFTCILHFPLLHFQLIFCIILRFSAKNCIKVHTVSNFLTYLEYWFYTIFTIPGDDKDITPGILCNSITNSKMCYCVTFVAAFLQLTHRKNKFIAGIIVAIRIHKQFVSYFPYNNSS